MLKYEINIKETDNEITNLEVASYDFEYMPESDHDNQILVTCYPHEIGNRGLYGENITVLVNYHIENDVDDTEIVDMNRLVATVLYSDEETGGYSFMAPRYRNIGLTSVTEVEDEDGHAYWQLYFDKGHLFRPEDVMDITLSTGISSSETLELTGLEYVDCKTLLWEKVEYTDEADIGRFERIESVIFDNIHEISDVLTVIREQTMFVHDFNSDMAESLSVMVVRPKVHIAIPIQHKFTHNVLRQHVIDTEFVDNETMKSIPSFLEMEKNVYHPVCRNENGYVNVTKINFNLHFREHSGPNWTVEPTDGWNFSRYGYTNMNDRYYSYPESEHSNQSDLLGYIGFNNNDVRYQKNKIRKSFLRLSFYDSPNIANQNLLATSTLFMDINKLYSKYMRGQNLRNWFVYESNPTQSFDSIATNMELNVNGADANIPANIRSNSEKIEEYRLSTRISVGDKYSSTASSEGFYLYLWADNGTEQPVDIYMKAEFNHAGYGRTIPMMMPYDKETHGFKSNEDIIDDWNNGGYGMSLYTDYMYLKMKYVYDADSGRYLYYIDDSIYGNVAGPILNINLYEARINF